jgi:hypothetical protein
MRTIIATAIAVAIVGNVAVWAHQMTVKGTVQAIEAGRIQVKTGEEKKGVAPTWYPIGAKTKIFRGKKEVTFAQAKITVSERVVVNVDHASNGTMTTLDIRLAEQ